MKIEGVTCYAYFQGKDGRGTCDDGCQWFVKDHRCPQTYTEEEWRVKHPTPEAERCGKSHIINTTTMSCARRLTL